MDVGIWKEGLQGEGSLHLILVLASRFPCFRQRGALLLRRPSSRSRLSGFRCLSRG